MLRVVLALVAVAAASAPARAEIRPQHPYRIETGNRVRLWSAPDLGGFQATNAVVTASDASGLTVVIKDRTELITFDMLSRMDVRRGWRYMRRGALVGLVIGAAAGALADGGDTDSAIESGAIYGAIGAGAGALTAGAIWPARWIPVDLERIRPQPEASLRGPRVSFKFSF